MINFVLIFLIIVLYFVLNTEPFSNTDDTLDDNIDTELNCHLYGCNSSRNDTIEWIGLDENNNEIFTDNKKDLFVFNNGFLNKVENVNFSKITKNDSSISIPTHNNNDKTELKIKLKLDDFTFCGYLTNSFYRLQYLVYKKTIFTEIENDQLYEYIVVKIIDNEYKIMHKLPYRQKIENYETIWINYGPINLGPLVFTTNI